MKLISHLTDAKDFIQSGTLFRDQYGALRSKIFKNESLENTMIDGVPPEISHEIFYAEKDAYVVYTYSHPIAVFSLENGHTTLEVIHINNFENKHSRKHIKMLEKWFEN